MRNIIILSISMAMITGCKKEKPEPEVQRPKDAPQMEIKSIDDTVRFGKSYLLHVDNDRDVDFSVASFIIGDAATALDRRVWEWRSGSHAQLALDQQEQTPMLNLYDSISAGSFGNFQWLPYSTTLLLQKLVKANQPDTWDGNWANANHNFLPIKIFRNDQHFGGWVEISFLKASEKLVIHRAAVSKLPGVRTYAGL